MLFILSLMQKLIRCYPFTTKTTYSCTYYIYTMAAVLGQIRWPSLAKAELKGWGSKKADPVIKDPRAAQLEEAKEILAEIFAIDIPEVEDMIRDRLKERSEWPQILCLEPPGGRRNGSGT
jgi:hypothetical protein